MAQIQSGTVERASARRSPGERLRLRALARAVLCVEQVWSHAVLARAWRVRWVVLVDEAEDEGGGGAGGARASRRWCCMPRAGDGTDAEWVDEVDMRHGRLRMLNLVPQRMRNPNATTVGGGIARTEG